MKRVQSHPGTLAFRHTAATELVIDRLRGQDAPRVLSFGCSWGAEIVPLALGLPNATIIGAELEDKALASAALLYAHSQNVQIIKSNWDDLAKHAPYDAIFCNAVLCKYPLSKTTDDLSKDYPIEEFSEVLSKLDALLKPGGFLMAYNTNYSISDTAIAVRYTSLPLPPSMSYFGLDNFVCHFAPGGRKIIHIDANGPSFFVDVADDYQQDRRFVATRLNEGLFIKSRVESVRIMADRQLAHFDSKRSDFNGGIAIDLENVYRSSRAHADHFRRIPMEQLIRRSEDLSGKSCYEVTWWWGDQLLTVPRKTF